MSDNNFTEEFLKKFSDISADTIETLVKNGYQTQTSLIFLDLEKDLPNIPDISMAQISVLRYFLAEYQTKQKALRLNFDKNLFDELDAITDTTPVLNVNKIIDSPPKEILLPQNLTHFDSDQKFLTVPLTGCELGPIASTTTQLNSTFTLSSSSQQYIDIPQESDDIICLPSTSRSTHSISSTSSSTPYISHQTIRRRFVRIGYVIRNSRRRRVESRLNTESPQNETTTCDKSTDSPVVIDLDTDSNSDIIKPEVIEEVIKETSLKTPTNGKSLNVNTDNEREVERMVVPNVVPLRVNMAAVDDSTDTCDPTTDPKYRPKVKRLTKKQSKHRNSCSSLKPLKNDNKSLKRRSDRSLSPINTQSIDSFNCERNDCNEILSAQSLSGTEKPVEESLNTDITPMVIDQDTNINVDTDINTEVIKEVVKQTSLKTKTIEKSSDVNSDNKQEVEEKVVPNAVPLKVISGVKEDSTESCDLSTDPKCPPKVIHIDLNEEDIEETSLKTTTIEKSSNVNTDYDKKQVEGKVVTNAVPLEVSPCSKEDSTVSYDLQIDPKTPLKVKIKRRPKRKKLCSSFKSLKNDNKSPKSRPDRSQSANNTQSIDSFNYERNDCNEILKETEKPVDESLNTDITQMETNQDSLNSHKSFHCGAKDCYQTFSTKQAINEHKIAAHLKSIEYQCDVEGCGLSFSDNQSLIIHKRIHLAEKQTKYDINGCKVSKKFNCF